jgi:hypothetical protein
MVDFSRALAIRLLAFEDTADDQADDHQHDGQLDQREAMLRRVVDHGLGRFLMPLGIVGHGLGSSLIRQRTRSPIGGRNRAPGANPVGKPIRMSESPK